MAALKLRYKLEKSSWIWIVGDQQVLGLLVVIKHHEVVLTTNSRLLISTESRVSWLVVVLIHPHTTSLDGASCTVNSVLITAPHTCTQAVVGVISNPDGFIEVLEGGNR